MARTTLQLGPGSDDGMCGPRVQLRRVSDGVSVEVGHGFAATALTPQEWAALAAERDNRPYVLVDHAPGRKPVISPLRTYGDAMGEFNREVDPTTRTRDYFPDSGRSLRVMSRDDYLKARENWGVSDADLEASARRVAGLRTASDLDGDRS